MFHFKFINLQQLNIDLLLALNLLLKIIKVTSQDNKLYFIQDKLLTFYLFTI